MIDGPPLPSLLPFLQRHFILNFGPRKEQASLALNLAVLGMQVKHWT